MGEVQELFYVLHQAPAEATANIVGMFGSKEEAAAAVLGAFRKAVEGGGVEEVIGKVKEDGMLVGEGRSAGKGVLLDC